ncbi:MAG: hypothetical protein ACPGAQ_04730, partial [Candidatus Puniceispirillaceae bacterium]
GPVVIIVSNLRHDAGQKFLVTIKTLFCNRPNAVNCLCASILPAPKKVQAITAYTPSFKLIFYQVEEGYRHR